MRHHTVILACLCSALVYSAPVADYNPQALELVQIPLANNQELDILQLAEANGRLSDRNKRTIGILRDLFPDLTKVNGENSIDVAALSEQLEETIRVARQAAAAESLADNKVSENSDQQPAESSAPAIDELTLDTDEADGDDRNKRFLSFGFGGSGQAAGGAGGSGGSGNFLFDIIRLFSGSVANQQQDERANAPDATSDSTSTANAAADGYTEGIPGPVTRLFVLANRGLSNLIQDLILRIAQTSERVVNFKARLITSLI